MGKPPLCRLREFLSAEEYPVDHEETWCLDYVTCSDTFCAGAINAEGI
jgi:hypothetical protein